MYKESFKERVNFGTNKLVRKDDFAIERDTVWKFQDFTITQIFREINFGDSRSAKSAISTHLEALNFDFS